MKDSHLQSRSTILDPGGQFIPLWNVIFLLCCVISVSLDPLFFYIPVIDGTRKCLDLDRKLEITACVLRSIMDVFYVLHIIFQFRTGFISTSSQVVVRSELIDDPHAIARRYLSSYFIIDILAMLPLPQFTVLVIIPNVNGPISLITKDLLRIVILVQYVPRLVRIISLYKVTRTYDIFTEIAWTGAAFNLLLYMLASHLLGAFWYSFTIEREDRCWRYACAKNNRSSEYLYCGVERVGDFSFLNTSCPLLESSEITDPTQFDFGIFIAALRSRVVEEKNFARKFSYCFWWGLRNLSSLGQNLQTSTFVWENHFAVFIAILGLLLFALLIVNMQKYMESITVKKVEEVRVQRRDLEQWMSDRMLPDNVKARIRRYEQYKWRKNKGVEEESLIRNLPKDLRRDVKRHICWSFLKRVPVFGTMDDQFLQAMCDRLKPVLYTKNSYVILEGDPVDEMLFVMRGELLSAITNGGRTGFLISVYLKAGDFCGEELLTWALDPNSSSSLPLSTRTVKAVSDVEAFVLMADDLKFVVAQVRLVQQLQHTFRFYSQQWRTWAAGFIQVVWRRYCHRKLDQSLRQEEDRLKYRVATEGGGSTLSLAATIYASKFAANALHALRHNHVPSPKLPPRIPTLLPQKPAEPDFSSGNRK